MSMKFLSYGVMIYMLLALIWWSVLLTRNNELLYSKNIALKELHESYGVVKNTNNEVVASKITEEYKKNKFMILGEGLVFGISLILGMWFIQNAYAKELENSNKQKNFLLSVTHELKSPLASINLITETLLKRKLSEEKTIELQESILEESIRLEKLINNLLLASRLDNAYQYNFEPCHLDEIVPNIIKRLKNQYINSNIVYHPTQQSVVVQADREALISVIANVLENALKYSPEGKEVNLSISVTQNMVHVTVRDQGVGIADIEKTKVMKQFYRIGSEDTRQTKGTGLGLYIVDKIVRAHNGKIKISDVHPTGTNIEISLPITQ